MSTVRRSGTPRPTALIVPEHLRELADALPIMLTFAAAREVMCTSVRTLRAIVARGEVRCVRSMRSGPARVLIPRSEVIRWMAERSS
jgi:hypothetical protein